MVNLKDYTRYIEENLKQINIPQAPLGLYDPMRYFLTIGGKRIRPVLTLLSTELFGGKKEDSISQALAIEVFHNFTLIHDDIMDEAPLRRGKKTVHKKWNSNTGILSGDVLMIKSYQLLSDVAPEKLPEILNVFNETAIEVCEGQQMDMDFESRNDVTIHEYIEMIRLKTSVLLGASLTIGAIVAGASDADKKALRVFGENIGIAFQIQDDILDLYGDADKFGKMVGGDILANKKTILMLSALSKSNASQIKIAQQISEMDNPALKIEKTKELFDHLQVRKESKEYMNRHYTIAMNALATVAVPEEKKQPLLELSNYLISRDI